MSQFHDDNTPSDVSRPATLLYRELFELHGLGEFDNAPTTRGTFHELVNCGWIGVREEPLQHVRRTINWHTGERRSSSTRLMYQCLLEFADNEAGDRETTPDDAPKLADIPPLDLKSGDWVLQNDAAEIAGRGLKSLRNDRSKSPVKAADGCSGIDPSGRMWRKKTKNARDVYYYKPFLS